MPNLEKPTETNVQVGKDFAVLFSPSKKTREEYRGVVVADGASKQAQLMGHVFTALMAASAVAGGYVVYDEHHKTSQLAEYRAAEVKSGKTDPLTLCHEKLRSQIAAMTLPIQGGIVKSSVDSIECQMDLHPMSSLKEK